MLKAAGRYMARAVGSITAEWRYRASGFGGTDEKTAAHCVTLPSGIFRGLLNLLNIWRKGQKRPSTFPGTSSPKGQEAAGPEDFGVQRFLLRILFLAGGGGGGRGARLLSEGVLLCLSLYTPGGFGGVFQEP